MTATDGLATQDLTARRLVALPGVFVPRSDSWLLADAVSRHGLGSADRVLDVCTGSGVVAVTAAAFGGVVTAVDVSRRAVLTARWNARRLARHVDVRRGSLFGPVGDDRFDLVTCNPPYVPAAGAELPRSGRQRAWAAGHDGRVVIDRICDEVAAHLAPGGSFLMVHSSLVGELRSVRRLLDAGLEDVQVLSRQRGPLGPLMRAQQQDGRVPAGLIHEDVVVIRARARRH